MAEYIERETLLAEIDETFFKTDPDGKEQIGVLKCRAIIRGSPAADVAPIVHGRWEEVDWIEPDDSNTGIIRFPKAALRCSHCKFAFKKELLWRNKYCPSCGARMDGADLGEPKGKTETEREAFDFLRWRFDRKE